jgi:uncharacterized protein YdaT
MVTYEKNRPYLKRVPIVTDVYDDIMRFDMDNLYPQRALEVMRRSYTLKAVIERVADFLNGEGFQDVNLANLKVNNKGLAGQTMNDLLVDLSLQYAPWRSLALHIGYNLNYRISSITVVPFEFCRLGVPDAYGKITDIKYSTNWERDGRKEIGDRKVETYPIFNPDPYSVQEQMEMAGGIQSYKGQIFYMTPDYGQYPLATFDPVIDHAQVQSELGLFKVSNVQNSFMGTLAIVYQGEFESEEEKRAFQELIANKSGARNAGSRIGIQDKSGTKKASDIFQNLSPTNLDKMYESTEKSVMDAIMENEAMPKELLGVRPESGMFNQENMEQAYTYFNAITRNRRSEISRAIKLLMTHWETPIQTDAFITPQRYIQEGAIHPNENFEVNDNLKNMTGMQAINFARILRKYGKGQYTRDVAETMLRGGFGLSDDEITKLLDAIDQTITEETGEEQAQAVAMALAKKYL